MTKNIFKYEYSSDDEFFPLLHRAFAALFYRATKRFRKKKIYQPQSIDDLEKFFNQIHPLMVDRLCDNILKTNSFYNMLKDRKK